MTEDGFLKAIQEDPDDDTHRLVYADWLEETGGPEVQARATLIRLQVELENPKRGTGKRELQKQIKQLLKENPKWSERVEGLPTVRKPIFSRGFLHQVTMTARRFPSVAKQLFEAAPMLRSVVFPQASNEVRGMAGCASLKRLEEIDLSRMCHCGHCPIGAELQMLFGSKHLGNVRVLRLTGNRMEEAEARALAAANVPRLRELYLNLNRLDNAGARALLEAPWLGQLERLDLRDNGIGVRAVNDFKQRLGKALKI